MNPDTHDLELRRALASAAVDFEEAGRLCDQINLIRGSAIPKEAARADTSGLMRQKSGAMGSARANRRQSNRQDGSRSANATP